MVQFPIWFTIFLISCGISMVSTIIKYIFLYRKITDISAMANDKRKKILQVYSKSIKIFKYSLLTPLIGLIGILLSYQYLPNQPKGDLLFIAIMLITSEIFLIEGYFFRRMMINKIKMHDSNIDV